MVLNRTTPANLFKIRTPVWSGGNRKVGLATYKIGTHNEIRIEAKTADGEKIYPNPFYISGSDARTYPIEPVKSNPSIKLHMIPISDLETLERA